jgi:hypothetical protein
MKNNSVQKIGEAGRKATVITSVSLEPELLASAKMLANISGYRFSFSAFLSDLIKKELECQRIGSMGRGAVRQA